PAREAVRARPGPASDADRPSEDSPARGVELELLQRGRRVPGQRVQRAAGGGEVLDPNRRARIRESPGVSTSSPTVVRSHLNGGSGAESGAQFGVKDLGADDINPAAIVIVAGARGDERRDRRAPGRKVERPDRSASEACAIPDD